MVIVGSRGRGGMGTVGCCCCEGGALNIEIFDSNRRTKENSNGSEGNNSCFAVV